MQVADLGSQSLPNKMHDGRYFLSLSVSKRERKGVGGRGEVGENFVMRSFIICSKYY
jgi:hypothetical protein